MAIELDARTWEGLEYLESATGPGAIAELVESFRQDASGRLVHMAEALQAADYPGLGRLAHDLKANSGTVGAAQLFSLAEWLEHAAREGAHPDIPEVLGKVTALLPEVLAALDERVQRHRA